jgi:Lrp/AsnC family transcriptional regulator of lysine biosynthesis
MDDKDKKIIERLTDNARTPFLQIAKDMNVSEGTIRKRVATLLKNKYIKKFTIETSYQSRAIIEVTTGSQIPTEKIVHDIQKIGVEKVFEVAGRFTLLCMVKADSLSLVNDIVESIRQVNGVIQTETLPVLKEN